MTRDLFGNNGRHKPWRQRLFFWVMKAMAPGGGGIFGFVEIGEGDGSVNEPALLEKAFPDKWRWTRIGTKSHTPIVFRNKNWDLLEEGEIRAADGRKGGWPHKWWVKVRLRNKVNGERRTRINGHLPPGAFNNQIDRLEAARKEEWHQMWGTLVEMVKEEVDVAKINTVVSCDANRQGDQPKPHPRAVLVAHHKTDYMWAIPAEGYVVDRRGEFYKVLGIDFHKGMAADTVFEEK